PWWSLLPVAAGAVLLTSCNDDTDVDTLTTTQLKNRVQTIVVIYAENRSFDNMYGRFPGANGIPGLNATAQGTIAAQKDRDATNSVLPTLPQTWGGVTAGGQTPVITQAQSANLANQPFAIETAFGTPVTMGTITRDLYHRFFEHQMQMNGGA